MPVVWPDLLEQLLAGEDLDTATAEAALDAIMDGAVDAAVTAGFLVALRAKGETVAEVTGLARAMREHALAVPVEGPLLDVVGTGGDRAGTINVSTGAALVCAGAGARVAKHGNRAASSRCGAADVLEALGVHIDLSPEGVAACIDKAGIGFCFAQAFHPAMRHVMPVRRALGIRTIFNVLGPLSNPASATHQMTGVASAALGPLVAEVLGNLGVVHAVVVHAEDGLDEVSTTGPSHVWEMRDGELRAWSLDPADFGLPRSSIADLAGGDAELNARALAEMLDGAHGPVRDIVALNAGLALYTAGVVPNVAVGLGRAREAIDSGAARRSLDLLVATSNLAAETHGE